MMNDSICNFILSKDIRNAIIFHIILLRGISQLQNKNNLQKKGVKLLIIRLQQHMEVQNIAGQYLAIIISQVKASSRQLYPLTKNYPMSLLPVGSKRLIVYQLESLLSVQSLAKVVIVTSEEDKALRQYVLSQFLTQHKQYPHKIEFFSVKDLSNTFAAVKEVLTNVKDIYESFFVLHADTLVGVSLLEMQRFHLQKNSDFTLLLKAKRQLSQQQKKLPQGEVETEIDNVLLGQNNEVLFIDMADQIENNGVKIDPSIYRQVKKATFRRAVDSKVYLISNKVGHLLLQLNSQEIYEMKPWLIQLLVQHQTNKKLININQHIKQQQLKPLKIYAHFSQQNTFIRKISNKKIYQCLNFDSLIRGQKQKELLLPTPYSDKTDDRKQYKNIACVAEGATLGQGGKIRRCIIGSGCKIGKNVQILNSILLDNVEIKDNCKINESVLGAHSSIGEGASIKGTYCESGCRVADGLKAQSQTLIRNE